MKIPKGWRRCEGSHPGRIFYCHVETGVLMRFPQPFYHPKKKTWIDLDGVAFDPEERRKQRE